MSETTSASSDLAASSPVETASSFQPYVPDSAKMPELTWSAVLLGSLLGILFGASSLYLFLKVGMTVSASIPVAVLAITVFRWLSRAFGTRRATILENNIVQTAGSAGESIAFGVGAAMPALMLLGYEMEWTRVMLVAVLGGLLGILMMIPLRRAFVVKQHKLLKYPEGTACAKVLVAGEQGGSNARMVFRGFGIGLLYQVMMQALKLWSDAPSRAITGISGYKKAELALEPSPALLGVGYILGIRISSIMVGGGLLASLLLIPAIALFGEQQTLPLAPATALIRDMSPAQIWNSYVRYIGAGAVAAAGILSMLRAMPLIIGSIHGGLKDLRGGGQNGSGNSVKRRTERDLPISFVLLGSLVLVAAISGSNLIPTTLIGRLVGAVMVVLFGFLFVTVSSRITGEMGSSSNPISGMTIATLLLTCAVFVVLGWIGPEYRLMALSIAGVVCIASSNGGTTSQDLKTGYLVGATPWAQQVAILVGALTSALVIGGTLLLLNWAYTTTSDKPSDLPTQKADVATLHDTETGPDGQLYKVWQAVGVDGVLPGKYLVDETGQARFLIDPGYRRAHDDDSDRHADQEVRSAATAAVRRDHRRHHEPETALGIGDAGRGTHHRAATERSAQPGIRRGCLSAAVDNDADLCGWLAAGIGGSRAQILGGRIGHEPGRTDVDRADRRRITGRDRPGRAGGHGECRQVDRLFDKGQRRPDDVSDLRLPGVRYPDGDPGLHGGARRPATEYREDQSDRREGRELTPIRILMGVVG